MTLGRTPALQFPHLHRQSSSALERLGLRLLARLLAPAPVELQLRDGLPTRTNAQPVAARVRLADDATLLRLLWRPDVAFGDAYVDGRLTVEGDLVAVLTAVARASVDRKTRPPGRWCRRGDGAPVRAARDARRHYDLGNEFYRRWLDRELVYTCAYYDRPDASLDEAQAAKLEYVARKLRLRPGERVIEAGSGWGALALHLAREHGVTVRAWNVSTEQVAWARRRAHELGLTDRVSFLEGDYRTIDGACDAFVSIGMLEHVGRSYYADLGRVIDRTLDPGHGRGLLHFIGRNRPTPMSEWIARDIFPGAYIPSLGEALAGVLESGGLSVVDVENLRPHYARTLAQWLERFERVAPAVTRERGAAFTRMWRLYLMEAQAGFLAGALQLFQVVFARPRCDRVPWTRDDLYVEMPS